MRAFAGNVYHLHMRRFAGLIYILLLAAGASLANCAGRFDELCDEADQCAHGNDADYEACVSNLDTHEEIAAINGCDNQFDRWFECFQENNRCDNDNEDEDLEPGPECEDEGADLYDCIN